MKYEIKQLNDTDAVVINSLETLSNNGDYFLGHPNYDKLFKWNMPEKTQHEGKQVWIKKVIATISPFKIEGLPMLELPNQEEDIKKLALDFAKTPILNHKEQDLNTEIWISGARQQGFIAGYKAAQKQFSESDMINAFIEGSNSGVQFQSTCEDDYGEAELCAKSDLEYFKQSLQKKQFPTSVELTEDLQIIKWYYK